MRFKLLPAPPVPASARKPNSLLLQFSRLSHTRPLYFPKGTRGISGRPAGAGVYRSGVNDTMGIFSAQISTRKMVPLCRQLATADQAGIPILQSLDLVGRQARHPKTREVLMRIREGVRNGNTL